MPPSTGFIIDAESNDLAFKKWSRGVVIRVECFGDTPNRIRFERPFLVHLGLSVAMSNPTRPLPMFFSAADVLPLAAKLSQYEKHASYLSCTKRARELYDEATALQTATQTKVAKLQHDAHLETTKIEINALPSQSPYPMDEDGKAMRSNDQLAFTTRVAILLKETLIRVKAGDMAWVFTGGKSGAFYSKVRLVKFETSAGSDGGKAAYLGPDDVPVELDWTTPGSVSARQPAAFSPQIGDIVDAQSDTGSDSQFRGMWFESKIVGETSNGGAECFEVLLGYPVDKNDKQYIPIKSRRIQPKGTFTKGPFDNKCPISSLPKTVLVDSSSFTLPAAARVKSTTSSDHWALLPVASPPTVSENDMKYLLECYFTQLGSGITFLPAKDNDDAKDQDDADMDMRDVNSMLQVVKVGRGFYYGKDKVPVEVVEAPTAGGFVMVRKANGVAWLVHTSELTVQ